MDTRQHVAREQDIRVVRGLGLGYETATVLPDFHQLWQRRCGYSLRDPWHQGAEPMEPRARVTDEGVAVLPVDVFFDRLWSDRLLAG